VIDVIVSVITEVFIRHWRILWSASSSKYVTPRLRTRLGECAFSHARLAAWNSLQPDIHAAASPAIFKKLLKMHFFIFSTAFSLC